MNHRSAIAAAIVAFLLAVTFTNVVFTLSWPINFAIAGAILLVERLVLTLLEVRIETR